MQQQKINNSMKLLHYFDKTANCNFLMFVYWLTAIGQGTHTFDIFVTKEIIV